MPAVRLAPSSNPLPISPAVAFMDVPTAVFVEEASLVAPDWTALDTLATLLALLVAARLIALDKPAAPDLNVFTLLAMRLESMLKNPVAPKATYRIRS